jgi:peptidyl-prolyl cis-trans isomerase D
MLQSIRKHAGSFVVKILFIVLILSFFVWGIADVVRPTPQDSWAAKVAEQTISREAFDQEYQATVRRVQQQLGGSITPEELRGLGLGRNVIDQMVNRALITEAGRNLAIATPGDQAKRVITADRRFHNEAGQFDPRILQQFLRQVGMSEQGFLAEVRNEIDITALLDGFTGGVVLPRVLEDTIRAYAAERREVDFIRIAFDQQKVGEPDEAALKAYFDGHGDAYMTPELRAVEVLVVDPASVAGQVQVSDEALKAAFEERQDEFITPERRSFRQILFDDEAKARAAAEAARGGASLDRIAADGTPPPAGFGPVSASQLPQALRGPLFAAGQGLIGEPVKSPLGWHLVEVIGIEPEVARPFAEVAPTLRQQLTQEKAEELVIDLGNRIEDGLGRGQPLPEIARSVGLTPRTIAELSRDGRDAAGRPVPDLPPKLADTAFATARGATSDLVEATRDQYFLLQVNEVTPAVARPFAEVRGDVRAAWLAAEQRQRAADVAARIAERAGGGGRLADAGRDFGLTAGRAGPFGRQQAATEGPLPEAVVRRALDGPAGSVLTVPGDDAVFVLRATTVPAAAPPPPGAADAEISQALQAMREDVLGQYLAALRARYPVTINERVVAGTAAGG